MALATELELPSFDHTDPGLRGDRYREAMAGVASHDGWLAANPYGYTVLEREAGEFFLRTKDAVFPGLTIAEMFGIADGPLHEEIVRNIININGADHGRLRRLVNPALSPRAVERYRPAMREFLDGLLDQVPDDGSVDFVADFAKPYPSLVIAEVMGAPLADAPRLHHWSNWIQRQFDAGSLMTERELIEEAVAEFYVYEDELIAARRAAGIPIGDDLISALIEAEDEGDRLNHDELRNLILNILVGGVDTSQSQLAHAVRLLALHPDQWERLRADPRGLALAGDRGGAPLRADHAVHRADHDRRDRVPRRDVPAELDRARVRVAREPRRDRGRHLRHPCRPPPRAAADVRRRHPLLRRREPGARGDGGGGRVPGRAGALASSSPASRCSAPPPGSTGSIRCRFAWASRLSWPAT